MHKQPFQNYYALHHIPKFINDYKEITAMSLAHCDERQEFIPSHFPETFL